MPSAKVGTPGPRASWRGALRFGLVSFSVEAYNAVAAERESVSFHQLHAECHSRIKYEKVCPIHGAVPNHEIVKAYEYAKGKYVEMDPGELNQLRTKLEKQLTIDNFISVEEVDPILFDGRRYVLVPDGAASREPYAVFLAALERSKRYGVGKFVLSSREHPAVIRPADGALHLAVLSFAEDIRSATDLVGDLPAVKATDKTLKLAEKLIENWTDPDFDWAQYHDEYERQARELIQAKVEDRDVVAPPEEDEPEVVNLMDALKKSIAGKSAGKAAPRRAASARSKKKRRAS